MNPLSRFFKEIFYQSGLLGTLLTFAFYPYYLRFLSLLENLLSTHYTERVGFTIVMTLAHIVTYCTINGLFASFDYFGLYQQYKLDRKPHMKAKTSLIAKTLIDAAVGQLIVGPILLFYLHGVLRSYLGLLSLTAPLPSSVDIFTTYSIAYLFNCIGFYTSHRLLHSKLLYARFHKQHHEYTGSMSISAEYAGPLETVFANMLPSIGGVIFFGCHHPSCFVVWIVSTHHHHYTQFTQPNSLILFSLAHSHHSTQFSHTPLTRSF